MFLWIQRCFGSNSETPTKKKSFGTIGSKFQVPCLCCQHTAITPFLFECAHVMAESQGGSTTVENLRPCCAMCNRSMGKRNFFEFQKEFFSKKTH